MAMMGKTMEGGPEGMGMPPDEAGGMSQGYCIELYVLPDGTFTVSGPEAMPTMKGMEGKETYDSIGAALKGVLELIKQNPIGGEAGEQFEAGYVKG